MSLIPEIFQKSYVTETLRADVLAQEAPQEATEPALSENGATPEAPDSSGADNGKPAAKTAGVETA